MRTAIFLLIFSAMGIGDVAWWRSADARLKKLRRGSKASRGALAAFGVATLIYLVALFALPGATRRSNGPIPMAVHAAGFVWHLLILPLLLVARLIRLPVGIARRLTRRPTDLAVPVSPVTSRRTVIAAAAVGLPPLLMTSATVVALGQLGRVRVRRFEVRSSRLPAALDGTTIAHVSDLHVGKFTREGSLHRLADQVNSLECDFVAVTGDLIDLSLADLPRALAMLRRVDPRNGMFICEGNHDLIEDRGEFEKRMKTSGFTFLLESERTIQFRGGSIQFLGTRWGHSDADLSESVARVVPLIRPDAFAILLAHHPHAFDSAAASGIPLTLSGHTHGGQIMLNERLGFGPAMFRYWSGLYARDESALVVSNGAGNWFPLRVNAPADIVHLTLRRASA